MVSVLQKVLGDPNEKALKKLAPFVKDINELEPKFQQMTNTLPDRTHTYGVCPLWNFDCTNANWIIK